MALVTERELAEILYHLEVSLLISYLAQSLIGVPLFLLEDGHCNGILSVLGELLADLDSCIVLQRVTCNDVAFLLLRGMLLDQLGLGCIEELEALVVILELVEGRESFEEERVKDTLLGVCYQGVSLLVEE